MLIWFESFMSHSLNKSLLVSVTLTMQLYAFADTETNSSLLVSGVFSKWRVHCVLLDTINLEQGKLKRELPETWPRPVPTSLRNMVREWDENQ